MGIFTTSHLFLLHVLLFFLNRLLFACLIIRDYSSYFRDSSKCSPSLRIPRKFLTPLICYHSALFQMLRMPLPVYTRVTKYTPFNSQTDSHVILSVRYYYLPRLKSLWDPIEDLRIHVSWGTQRSRNKGREIQFSARISLAGDDLG